MWIIFNLMTSFFNSHLCQMNMTTESGVLKIIINISFEKNMSIIEILQVAVHVK